MTAIARMDLSQPPPVMGGLIHRTVRQQAGNEDPYAHAKEHFNRLALQLVPQFRATIRDAANPLETAVRLAIAGNIIDFATNAAVDQSHVHAAVANSLTAPLDGPALAAFTEAVEHAQRILYLGDNAGEIVFDRLLIERLPREKMTFVVKGSPVINDATWQDAQIAGISDIVPVIDNGSDIPGTILEDCSPSFRERFAKADLVISKGQGNYESLSDAEKTIFFMFKAKCHVITMDIGCEMGSMIVRKGKTP